LTRYPTYPKFSPWTVTFTLRQTKRVDFTFLKSTSLSSIAIFQHNQRMVFTQRVRYSSLCPCQWFSGWSSSANAKAFEQECNAPSFTHMLLSLQTKCVLYTSTMIVKLCSICHLCCTRMFHVFLIINEDRIICVFMYMYMYIVYVKEKMF
jgi:hypothetical protein